MIRRTTLFTGEEREERNMGDCQVSFRHRQISTLWVGHYSGDSVQILNQSIPSTILNYLSPEFSTSPFKTTYSGALIARINHLVYKVSADWEKCFGRF